MNETPIWLDIVGNRAVNTTGAKDIPLKLTGNEKANAIVCLTAKADSIKLKPVIVFQGAKQEATTLSKYYKHLCVVTSSPNG